MVKKQDILNLVEKAIYAAVFVIVVFALISSIQNLGDEKPLATPPNEERGKVKTVSPAGLNFAPGETSIYRDEFGNLIIFNNKYENEFFWGNTERIYQLRILPSSIGEVLQTKFIDSRIPNSPGSLDIFSETKEITCGDKKIKMNLVSSTKEQQNLVFQINKAPVLIDLSNTNTPCNPIFQKSSPTKTADDGLKKVREFFANLLARINK